MGHTTNQERLKMSDAENDFYPFSNEQNWLKFKADQENWSNFKAEVERLTRHFDEHMGLQRIEISHDVLERIVRESSEKDAVIERLRGLLKRALPFTDVSPKNHRNIDLQNEIKKEMGDE